MLEHIVFFVLLFAGAVFATTYDAVWISHGSLETDGYLSAALIPSPGADTCLETAVCMPRIDFSLEIFPSSVRIRAGPPSPDGGLDPGPAGRVPLSRAHVDVQYTSRPFGLRVVRRNDGAVLWNSVLAPELAFVDGRPWGDFSQQLTRFETALPTGGWSVSGLGRAGALVPGLSYPVWSTNCSPDDQVCTGSPRVAADINGTVPVLVVTPPLQSALASGPTLAPFLVVSGSPAPLSVTLSRTGDVVGFTQTGGLIDVAIFGINCRPNSLAAAGGGSLAAAMADARAAMGMARSHAVPAWARGLQLLVDAPTFAEAHAKITRFDSSARPAVPGSPSALTGGAVWYLGQAELPLVPHAAHPASDVAALASWLAELGAGFVGAALPLVPSPPHTEDSSRAADVSRRLWADAAAAGALIPAHPHQGRSAHAPPGTPNVDPETRFGVYYKELAEPEPTLDTHAVHVGALDLARPQAVDWYARTVRSAGRSSGAAGGADLGYTGYFAMGAQPELACDGTVCSDGVPAVPSVQMAVDPTSSGLSHNTLPYDQDFADDAGTQGDAAGSAFAARRAAQLHGFTMALERALLLASGSHGLVVSDTVVTGVTEAALVPFTFAEGEAAAARIAGLPARLALAGVRTAGVVARGGIPMRRVNVGAATRTIRAAAFHPLFVMSVDALLPLTPGSGAVAAAIAAATADTSALRYALGRHIVPHALAPNAVCHACPLELAFADPMLPVLAAAAAASTGASTAGAAAAGATVVGGGILAAPILDSESDAAGARSLYLPAGLDWYQLGSRQRRQGGSWVTAPALRLHDKQNVRHEYPPFFVAAGTALVVPSGNEVLTLPAAPADSPPLARDSVSVLMYIDAARADAFADEVDDLHIAAAVRPNSHKGTLADATVTVTLSASASGDYVPVDGFAVTIPAEALPGVNLRAGAKIRSFIVRNGHAPAAPAAVWLQPARAGDDCRVVFHSSVALHEGVSVTMELAGSPGPTPPPGPPPRPVPPTTPSSMPTWLVATVSSLGVVVLGAIAISVAYFVRRRRGDYLPLAEGSIHSSDSSDFGI